jgi:catechol 2,3-dioxygenase-like lactoylglutathione lyase family enzyme
MFQQAVTTLPVHDLEVSIAFYVGVLDFRIIHRFEQIAYLSGPGITIALRPGLPIPDKASVLIGFMVRDLQEAQRNLERKGVTFVGEPVEASVSWVVFFNDPDGNSLYLFQWKAGMEKPL